MTSDAILCVHDCNSLREYNSHDSFLDPPQNVASTPSNVNMGVFFCTVQTKIMGGGKISEKIYYGENLWENFDFEKNHGIKNSGQMVVIIFSVVI